jgi:hypothetical protein
MINYIYGIRQWLLTLLAVAAVLTAFALWSPPCDAGWMYDVEGIMAPTLENPASSSFDGELEFTSENAIEGFLRISLHNEVDPETQELVVREATFAMDANLSTPIGQRIFSGVHNEEPFLMQWLDYNDNAELNFASMEVDTAGWDAIGISFVDYQLGTITALLNGREVPQVNEPAAMSLLAFGGLFVLGLLRAKKS